MKLPDPWENPLLYDALTQAQRCKGIMENWIETQRYMEDDITDLVQMAGLINDAINAQLGRIDGPSSYEVFATQQSIPGFLTLGGSLKLSSSTAIVPVGDNAQTVAKLCLLWDKIYEVIWEPTPVLASWLREVFEQACNARSLESFACLELPGSAI